ncbi:uncharacterized protein LOC143343942 isoform X2 [Colletes latitarsis]|uniref:uncharacterized protein LOC143343942 isoform X2 n=1 Tax=Colletes latitarsis TaxID=2605962 RepID=UPI0040375DFE
MSTTDPTGEGGGGGERTTISSTNIEENISPVTPVTGNVMPPGSQQQHPPPSPLSGCYLLVVLPEPHTAQHKDLILNRLSKGFLSWDKDSCHVDLEKELLALVAQAPEGEEARNGERLIQYATENLVTEVLIHPQTNTLLQCIRNLLASFTKHRHIIHAGYTFGGNGSWILQDGTFSIADFLDAFSEHEVQRVLRAYENSVTVDIHCAGVGDWTTNRLSKEACTRSCRVRVNPDDVLTAGVPAIASFTNYVGQYLLAQTLDQLMEPSDVVGNIRFSHPTLYVFPGGQGDAALFGINGFNMLVDGGFARKACFWDFTRHLDRLDAVLVTRINNSNVGGMYSVVRKKKEMHVYPQIGHFFCNLVERRQSNSPDGDKDIDPLILNLTDIGQEMVANLRHINLRAHPCYRDPDPINLYHKVGHGTLDMYVLSPNKDSREVREFLAKWHSADSKLFAGSHKKDSNNLTFPIQNLVSICVLLVWQPANPEDTITRILFPGSTPQHKIFEGFERLKHLEFLKHPVCSAKSLSPSTSLATLRDKPAKQKLSLIDKEPTKKLSDAKKEKRESAEVKTTKGEDSHPKSIMQSTPIISTKPQPGKIEVKAKKAAENKKIEVEGKEAAKESKKIEKELRDAKKEVPRREIATKFEKQAAEKQTEKPDKTEEEGGVKKAELQGKSEPEKTKESKHKGEAKKKESKETKVGVKVAGKPTGESLKPKLTEKKAKQPIKETGVVKSSPTTPKKTVNGVASKTEIMKVSVPRSKPSTGQKIGTAPPAKSAKDANNRKVVEQKKIEKSGAKETAVGAVKVSAKPKLMDRKPIGRRGKPVSPSKARVPGSPAKSTRSTPTTSVKSDKDGVIRKPKGDKGTTDSSTVSTPSGIEPETAAAEVEARLVDKSLIEKSEDISLDSIESKVLADLKEEREVVEEIEAVLQKAERIEETRKDDRFEGDDEITAEVTDKKEEDITEEDVTAEIEDAPKKDSLRKGSQELTEEDEYLIVEKEEVYTEDSVQSGEGEQKHVLDEAESEKAKILKDADLVKEKALEEEDEEEDEEEEDEEEEAEEEEEDDGEEEEEEIEEKEKDESAEKRPSAELKAIETVTKVEKEPSAELPSPDQRERLLEEETKEAVVSPSEVPQKPEEKDDSGKKDSEDITKEPSSLSPDKFDSSEKKTTDTDLKPEADQKEQVPSQKLEESQERISTIESGATTTAPTLPEDERIPLDEIKEDIDEKHIVEDVKEKDFLLPAKIKEEAPTGVPGPVAGDDVAAVAAVQRAALPPIKSDFSVFDARQAVQTLPRDIVKTPDEVADLPVHEEVDPKLYRMEDFEKDKEEKPPAQQIKEPPTPPIKEQKGVFSFLGKVADKFEKGIDKLTKKSKKDPEKDADDKSSSKSSSPKEAKVQEKTLLEEVDMEKMFPKVGKPSEKLEAPEEVATKVTDAKPVTVTEIVQDTVQEAVEKVEAVSEPSLKPEVESKTVPSEDSEEKKKKKEEPSPVIEADITPAKKEEQVEKIVEEKVEEGILEASKKPSKKVKESSRDSFESVEDETVEQVRKTPVKDVVRDTLDGVVEKLEEMQPQIETKEPEPEPEPEPAKAKFDVPKDEDFEAEHDDEEITEAVKDLKEAVRDVGEVLAGTVGIHIDDKPKDVTEIVKKVAQVLKGDDFLSDEALFGVERKETVVPITAETKSPVSEVVTTKPEDAKRDEKLAGVIPTKVGITEEFPHQEQVQELIEGTADVAPPLPVSVSAYKPTDAVQLHQPEKPCVKITKEEDDAIASFAPKDKAKDDRDAKEICTELLKEESICKVKKDEEPEEPTKELDVMEAGLEDVCVKEVAKTPIPPDSIIEESVIGFEQKISPAKAEIVTVSPGSTPTSPKFITDKLYETKEPVASDELSAEIKAIVDKVDRMVEEIIEELITKKKKVTIEIIEYITIVKRVPKERVIYIIEEIIVRKGLSREEVVDNVEILKLEESITPQLRTELEEYIINEYVTKGKRITVRIVEEISVKMLVPRTIIIRIIQEIIVKKKIDVPMEEGLFESKPEEPDKVASKLDTRETEEKESIIERTKREAKSVEPEEPVSEEQPARGEREGEEEEEDVEEDGFVTIGRKVSKETIDTEHKTVSPDRIEDAKRAIGQAHEKDHTDDFEAVEQEYKVHDSPVTSRDVSPKSDEIKEKDYAEEVIEDTVSDVVEADEKFVHETKQKEEKKELHLEKVEPKESKVETADALKSLDTIEKYLDEAKEKPDTKASAEPVDQVVVETVTRKESIVGKPEITQVREASPTKETLQKDQEKPLDVKRATPVEEKVPIEPEVKLADATGRATEPKPEPDKREPEETEDRKSPDESIDRKDSKIIEPVSSSTEIPITVEAAEDTGSVRRMLVTASSEDGGHETEICPSGSITFTKTLTPDDSLKDASVKSTPDKDSLLLDKDSLLSGTSSPEKDSISEKSPLEMKHVGKVTTPEDSLDKSPVDRRDSQDLEDSLEKVTTVGKAKEMDSTSPSIDTDTPKSPQPPKELVDKEKTPPKTDKVEPIESSSSQVSDKTPDTIDGEVARKTIPVPKSPDQQLFVDAETSETVLEIIRVSKSPESIRSEDVSPAETIFAKSPTEKLPKGTTIDVTSGKPEKETLTQIAEATVRDSEIIEEKEIDSKSREKSPDTPDTKAEGKVPKVEEESARKDDIESKSSSISVDKSPSLIEKKPDLQDEPDERKSPKDTVTTDFADKEKSPSTPPKDELGQEKAVQESRPASIGKEAVEKIKSPIDTKITETSTDKSRSPSVTSETTVPVLSKSPQSPASEKLDLKDVDEKRIDKSRSPSVTSVPVESKEPEDRSKSPSVAKETTTEQMADKSRSASVASLPGDSKEPEDGSKSPSIASEKLDDIKDTVERTDKSRSGSVASDFKEPEPDRSKSPSLSDEKAADLKQLEKSRSPSAEKETKEPPGADGTKSPSVEKEKIDEGKVVDADKIHAAESLEKARSPSIVSGYEESVETDRIYREKRDLRVDEKSRSPSLTPSLSEKPTDFADRSKTPSIASDKSDLKDVAVDKSRSPSVTSVSGEPKEVLDRSKTPSIASEKPDFKQVDEKSIDKSRSPSVTSPTLDEKPALDRSKSPSLAGEKFDPEDVEEIMSDKSRSPSVMSVSGEPKAPTDPSKSPSVAGELRDAKDADLKVIDKSRSPSVTSVSGEPKGVADRSKSPGIAGEKSDSKDVDEPVESKSPTLVGAPEQFKEIDRSKSPSTTPENPDEKPVDKSSLASVTSSLGEFKEPIDRSKSASIIDSKQLDEETIDKSRSASVISVQTIPDDSRSPSTTTEKPDIKDVEESKETLDRSKSPSIAGEKTDLTEMDAKQIDKSRSSSVTSVSEEAKGTTDHSKSPSIAGEKPDLKGVDEKLEDKSRSASVISIGESQEGKKGSKSPSTTTEILDLDDVDEKVIDKSKSVSATSSPGETKETVDREKSEPSIADMKYVEEKADKSRSGSVVGPDHSRSASIAGEKFDLAIDDNLAVDKSRSSSVISVSGEGKEIRDRSKSPTAVTDKPDSKQVEDKQEEKSKSPSVTGSPVETKEPMDREISPSIDKSRSASVTSTLDEAKETLDRSKSPSIAGEEKLDVKDVDDKEIEKSPSPSVAGELSDLKDIDKKSIDKSRTPSATSSPGEAKETLDRSKSPSIAGEEKPDVKDVDEKCRSPSEPSISGETKDALDHSKPSSIAAEKPCLKEVDEKVEKSRSPSVTSPVDAKETPQHSKSPSIVGEKSDFSKDVEEKAVIDKSRSPSVTSVVEEPKQVPDHSPTTTEEKSDFKEVDEKTIDKSRSASLTSPVLDEKLAPDRSKSPSLASEKDVDDRKAVEKSRSPSVTSVSGDTKEAADRSKTPSTTTEKPELTDVEESAPTEKSRSPSVPEPEDHSKSWSVADIIKDIDDKTTVDKSRSPSVISVTDESKQVLDRSKTPSTTEEKPDLKEVDKSRSPTASPTKGDALVTSKPDSVASEISDSKDVDKSRSPSVASVAGEPKEALDRSKTPSTTDEKPDLKEVDKSRSVTVSPTSDTKETPVPSKPASVTSEKSDTKDVDDKAVDKSRSPSVTSVPGESKVTLDRSKTPSTTEEKPDVTDVDEQPVEKSRSPSVISVAGESKETLDRSKTPSTTEEKPDLKDADDDKAVDKSRSPSVTSVTRDAKDALDRSKTPSTTEEKPDLKDVDEKIIDKSRSPSVSSVLGESKEPLLDRSKTPSTATEKSDFNQVDEKLIDKSRDAIDREKSASITEEKSDQVEDQPEKSRSASVASVVYGESKDAKSSSITDKLDESRSLDHPKSSSVADDKLHLADVDAKTFDKSRSPSVTSISGESKSVVDHSKSPSVEKSELTDIEGKSTTTEKPDLMDVYDKVEKSKSPSPASDSKETLAHSKSPSITSPASDSKDTLARSKSPSVSSEKPDIKDVDEVTIGKSRSSSVISVPEDLKESTDRSKSPSTTPEKPDLKIAEETAADKSSITSSAVDKNPIDKSRSPSVTAVSAELKQDRSKSSDLKETDKSRSGSVTSPSDSKDTLDRSKPPSGDSDKSDLKHVEDKARSASVISVPGVSEETLGMKDTSRSPSATSITSEFKDATDRSKSPSIPGDEIDLRDVDTKGVDKSKSASEASVHEEPVVDRTKSPSQTSDLGEPKVPSDENRSDSKESAEKVIDKSRSPSVSQVPKESKESSPSPSPSPPPPPPPPLVDSTKSPSPDKIEDASESPGPVSALEEVKKRTAEEDVQVSSSQMADRSRSQSVQYTGDKTPLTRSRAASIFEEKPCSAETEKTAGKSLDEEKEASSSSEASASAEELKKISVAVTKAIEKELGIMYETEKATSATRVGSSRVDIDREDEREDIVKVTFEKRTAVLKHILDEYVGRRKKITTAVIEELVMIYSVPEFVVLDIIKMITTSGTIRRESIVDIDEEEEAAMQDPKKRSEIEKYLTDEFVVKGKKITSAVIDEISALKNVSRTILVTIVKEMIVKNHLAASSIIDSEVEKVCEEDEKRTASKESFMELSVAQDHQYRDRKDASGGSRSPSLSSEPIASDKSTQDSPVRSEPHIDEEISISEEKRTEMEKLLEEEYIKKGKKITEEILEEVIVRTSLPRYIILEIIEEIIVKKKMSRELVVDGEIYQDGADESYEKDDYRYEKSPEPRYELADDGMKSSYGYKAAEYSPDARGKQLDTSMSDYPISYESQFHKAFVGGMTEIRTTHITTLSGKSTPDITRDGTPDSTSEPTASTVERVEDKSTVDGSKSSDVRVSPDKGAITCPVETAEIKSTQIVTVLKDSKIGEPEDLTKPELDKLSTTMVKRVERPEDEVIVIKKIVKREVVDEQEPEIISETITKREIPAQGDPETIRKIIKREIIEQDEPVVITKVVKREVVEIDETKELERAKEIATEEIVPEALETITTRTKKIVITEESSDSEATKGSLVTEKREGGEEETIEETGWVSTEAKQKDRQPMSPLVRDIVSDVAASGTGSGRSTPDRRSEGRSLTGTPEGFRSGEVIRTIITTTKTVSDDGEIVTTTREVTETTNEKGETVVLAEKVDVKVDEYLPSKDAAESAISSIIGSMKSSELGHYSSASDTQEMSEHADKGDASSSVGFSAAAMSSSFYGELPAVPPQISAMKTFQEDVETGVRKSTGPIPIPGDYPSKMFAVEKEYEDKPDAANKYADEPDFDFKTLMKRNESKDSSESSFARGLSPRYTNGSVRQDVADEHADQSTEDAKPDSNKDPLDGWGTPLGLPSPKPPQKFNFKSTVQPSDSTELGTRPNWGEPLRLPSPAPVTNEISNKGTPSTPKKEKKQARKVLSENLKNKKRSESPAKNEKKIKDSKNKIQPVYVDLTYVPHYGNSYYTSLDFFKRVRARYYVFSGTEPSREVYDALLEAKKTWEDKDLEVTIIPTYDTDTLGYWVADNEEILATNHIDLSPSASRCTINLQDHETSCSAYRLEF